MGLSSSDGLPLVGREWKNGSKCSYNCTPFLHSLLTKDKMVSTLLGVTSNLYKYSYHNNKPVY